MLRIGLIDVDGHNFPNLALMKISAYHKNKGDSVEWYFPLDYYDIVYCVKVFGDEYSKMPNYPINADKVVYGGSGFAIKIENGEEVYHPELDAPLPYEIEHIYPDYELYPDLTKNKAYGFLTRGCCNNCGFCIVSKKEGMCSKKVCDLSEWWNGQKEIVLMDANILACPDHIDLLHQLIDSKALVDFTQGLDARFITEKNVVLLKQVRKKRVHFAFDTMKHEKQVIRGLELYSKVCGTNPNRGDEIVYMLTNYGTTIDEDLYRLEKIKSLGYLPDVRVYRKPSAPKILHDMQRWCNNRLIYRSCDFFDYVPRKDGKTIKQLYFTKEE